jgi:hypothetical protein
VSSGKVLPKAEIFSKNSQKLAKAFATLADSSVNSKQPASCQSLRQVSQNDSLPSTSDLP